MILSIVSGLRHARGSAIWAASVQGVQQIAYKHANELLQCADTLLADSPWTGRVSSSIITLCRLVYVMSSYDTSLFRGTEKAGHLARQILKYATTLGASADDGASPASFLHCTPTQSSDQEKALFSSVLLSNKSMACELLLSAAAALDPMYFCEHVLLQLPDSCADETTALLKLFRSRKGLTVDHLTDVLQALPPHTLANTEQEQLKRVIEDSDTHASILLAVDKLTTGIRAQLQRGDITSKKFKFNPIVSAITVQSTHSELQKVPTLVPGPWLLIQLVLATAHCATFSDKSLAAILLRCLAHIASLLEGRMSLLLVLCALLHINSSCNSDTVEAHFNTLSVETITTLFSKLERWIDRTSPPRLLQTLAFQSAVVIFEYAKSNDIMAITQRALTILTTVSKSHDQQSTFLNILTMFAAELEELQSSVILTSLLGLQAVGMLGVSELTRILDDADGTMPPNGSLAGNNYKVDGQFQSYYLDAIEKAMYGSKNGARLLSCPLYPDLLLLHKPMAISSLSYSRYIEALEAFIFKCCFPLSDNILLKAVSPSFDSLTLAEDREQDYSADSYINTQVNMALLVIFDMYIGAGDQLLNILLPIYDFSLGFECSTKKTVAPSILPSAMARFADCNIDPSVLGHIDYHIIIATVRVLVCLYLQNTENIKQYIKQLLKKSKAQSITLLMGLCLLSDVPEFMPLLPNYTLFLNSFLHSCINIQFSKQKRHDSMSVRNAASPYSSSSNLHEVTVHRRPISQPSISYNEFYYNFKSDADPSRFSRTHFVLMQILYIALTKRLCDSFLIDDYIMLMVYAATNVFVMQSSAPNFLDIIDVHREKALFLFLNLAKSEVGAPAVCVSLLTFLFSGNLPTCISADSTGLLNVPLWHAKLVAAEILNEVVDILTDSQLLETLTLAKVYFCHIVLLLIEMLAVPVQRRVETVVTLFEKLLTRVLLCTTDIHGVESTVSFPNEDIVLISQDTAQIKATGDQVHPTEYYHSVYQAELGQTLFSHFAVIEPNTVIRSTYEYIVAVVMGHITKLRRRIASGQIQLLPWSLRTVHKFLATKRSRNLNSCLMMPGLRFYEQSPALVVDENIAALVCGVNAQTYQSSYVYWFECFLTDLLFSVPQSFIYKLFDKYEHVKRHMEQQVSEYRRPNVTGTDCHELVTFVVHTYNIISARRLVQMSSSLLVEQVSALHAASSTATGLSSVGHSRNNSVHQVLSSPSQMSPMNDRKGVSVTDRDREFQVELEIVLSNFKTIYNLAKNNAVLSLRSIMHFGHYIAAASGAISLAMIAAYEQKMQSTEAAVLLKCYAEFCNIAQFYRPIAKEDESAAAAERIKMVAPRSGTQTTQLEQCCKTLIYFYKNGSNLLFMDTTAHVLDALLSIPMRQPAVSTVQILLHLLGYVILTSGFPRIDKQILESTEFHRSTGNISKLADAPSYANLYRANTDIVTDIIKNKGINVHPTLFTLYPIHAAYRRLATYSANLVNEIVAHRYIAENGDMGDLDDYSEDDTSVSHLTSNKVTISTKIAMDSDEVHETPYASESILNNIPPSYKTPANPPDDLITSLEETMRLEASINPNADSRVETLGGSSILEKTGELFSASVSVSQTSQANVHGQRKVASSLQEKHGELSSVSFSEGISNLQTLTTSIASNMSMDPTDTTETAASFIAFLKEDRPCMVSSLATASTKQPVDVKVRGYFHLSALSSILSIMQIIDLPPEARALILAKVCLCIMVYEKTSEHKDFFRTYLANRVIRLLLLMVEQRPQFSTISNIVLTFSMCATSKLNPVSPWLPPLSSAILSYLLALLPHIVLQSIYGRYALQKSGLASHYKDFIGFKQVYSQCLGIPYSMDLLFEFTVLHCNTSVWFHILKMLFVSEFINVSVEGHSLIQRRTRLSTDGAMTIRTRNLTCITTVDELANGTIYRSSIQLLLSLKGSAGIDILLRLITKCTDQLQAYRIARLLYGTMRKILPKTKRDMNRVLQNFAPTFIIDSKDRALDILCRLCTAISSIATQEAGIVSIGLVPLFDHYPELFTELMMGKYSKYRSSQSHVFPRQYETLNTQDWLTCLLEQRAPHFKFEAILLDLKRQASPEDLDSYVITTFSDKFLHMKLAILELLLHRTSEFVSRQLCFTQKYESEEIVNCIIYMYYIIKPPADLSDELAYRQYQKLACKMLEKKRIYSSIFQLAIYIGHMSWGRLTCDENRVRKLFIYSVLSIPVLNSEANRHRYSGFVQKLERVVSEAGFSNLVSRLGDESKAPNFFGLNMWVFQLLGIFWSYCDYHYDFTIELQGALTAIKSINESDMLAVYPGSAEFVDENDANIPVEELVSSSTEPNSLLATRDLDAPATGAMLTSLPIDDQKSGIKISAHGPSSKLALADCSLFCLLLTIGSNRTTVLDYKQYVLDSYDWASEVSVQTLRRPGSSVTLTLYACLLLMSHNHHFIERCSSKLLPSTDRFLTALQRCSQRAITDTDGKQSAAWSNYFFAMDDEDMTKTAGSTTSSKLILSQLYTSVGASTSRLDASFSPALSQQPANADMDGGADDVEEHLVVEKSTIYGQAIPVVTTPYLWHAINCMTVLKNKCQQRDLLEPTKALLILILRHSQIRALLPKLASFIEAVKDILRDDATFMKTDIIPTISVPVCYQTATENNVAQRILATTFYIMNLQWSEDNTQRPVIESLLQLYTSVYDCSDVDSQKLLAFFSRLIVSESISNYARCNLVELLTSLAEVSLFSAEEILETIKSVLRGVRSTKVASQCLVSASKLLAM